MTRSQCRRIHFLKPSITMGCDGRRWQPSADGRANGAPGARDRSGPPARWPTERASPRHRRGRIPSRSESIESPAVLAGGGAGWRGARPSRAALTEDPTVAAPPPPLPAPRAARRFAASPHRRGSVRPACSHLPVAETATAKADSRTPAIPHPSCLFGQRTRRPAFRRQEGGGYSQEPTGRPSQVERAAQASAGTPASASSSTVTSPTRSCRARRRRGSLHGLSARR
jgi:hypothetical protein